jgi:hypothetical protein
MLLSDVDATDAIRYGNVTAAALRGQTLWAGLLTHALALYGLRWSEGKQGAAQLCLEHARQLESGITAATS